LSPPPGCTVLVAPSRDCIDPVVVHADHWRQTRNSIRILSRRTNPDISFVEDLHEGVVAGVGDVKLLLTGNEDSRIHDFFRRSAFPAEEHVKEILGVLEVHDGLSVIDLQQHLNMRDSQIGKVLKLLNVESPAPVIKQGTKWFRTPVHFQMDHERVEHLTWQRETEWREIQDYIGSNTCLMAYLRHALDDPGIEECGRCAVCTGESVIPESVDRKVAIAAAKFLRHAEMPFKPKIQVAKDAFVKYGFRGSLRQELRTSQGRILSRWRDSGWGGRVADDKRAGHFSDKLVEAAAEMYEQRWRPDPTPQWVTCAPSQNHPSLVPDFAQRLADRLGLPFVDAIRKVRDNGPQKEQQNRFHQCSNLDGAFSLSDDIRSTPVLLVDDVIDSGWTVTVLAALLRQAGSGLVYPVALASTSTGD
jgi:ATP-dependent DNA helicase RecQ